MKGTHARRGAEREGFALLAVLWILLGVASLGLAIQLAGRDAVAAARNRMNLTQAAWLAEGCLERARAVIGEALTAGESAISAGVDPWGALDQVVPRAPVLTAVGCDVELRAAGSAIDVNAADSEMLRRLFVALGIRAPRADSLLDALLDWRDGDDEPRPFGAERSWYAAHARPLPRNGPFADVRELRRVRGFEELSAIDRVLDVEPGRIALNHAPLEVLAALPGFTEETIARMAEQRLRGVRTRNLLDLSGALSPMARDSFLARFADLARLTTAEPDAWILRSRMNYGTPPVRSTLEVRLVRAGSRAAIVRRRSWVS
jgi:general secretion pathway protein K